MSRPGVECFYATRNTVAIMGNCGEYRGGVHGKGIAVR